MFDVSSTSTYKQTNVANYLRFLSTSSSSHPSFLDVVLNDCIADWEPMPPQQQQTNIWSYDVAATQTQHKIVSMTSMITIIMLEKQA